MAPSTRHCPGTVPALLAACSAPPEPSRPGSRRRACLPRVASPPAHLGYARIKKVGWKAPGTVSKLGKPNSRPDGWKMAMAEIPPVSGHWKRLLASDAMTLLITKSCTHLKVFVWEWGFIQQRQRSASRERQQTASLDHLSFFFGKGSNVVRSL